LSNFAPHPFVFEGVQCASMEGLLQSFKSPYPHIQVEICKLVGVTAKRRGSKIDWRKKQLLYWKHEEFPRLGEDYEKLLDAAYDALSANQKFRDALRATGTAVLKHSIGKTNPTETILTQQEFVSRLHTQRMNLRLMIL